MDSSLVMLPIYIILSLYKSSLSLIIAFLSRIFISVDELL